MPTNIAATQWEQIITTVPSLVAPGGVMPANTLHVSIQNRSETVDVFIGTSIAVSPASQRLDRNGGDAAFGLLDTDARFTSALYAVTDGPNARIACVAHHVA